MNPLMKLHLWSVIYCAVLTSLNWFRTTEYARHEGIHSQSEAPVLAALLVAGGVCFYLLLQCVRHAKLRLETGRRVAGGKWVLSWSVVIYALPLLFVSQTTSTWHEADGVIATATGGFGHMLSRWVFLCAAVSLFSFQVLMRLLPENGQRSGPAQTA